MSQTKNRLQAERWFNTAENDLRAVEALIASGLYAQACFYAQQSAKKAVKALWYCIDAVPWGHSVQRLIMEFPQSETLVELDAWIEHGALLDKYYIPTRYPNGLPDLTPDQVYRRNDAQRGLDAACALVDGCQQWLAQR